MKKLYLLTALLSVTAVNIRAMDNNDNDIATELESQITHNGGAQLTDLELDEQIEGQIDHAASHDDYRQIAATTMQHNMWANALAAYKKWYTFYMQSSETPESQQQDTYRAFRDFGRMIKTHAAQNGHGSKGYFLNIEAKTEQVRIATGNQQ